MTDAETDRKGVVCELSLPIPRPEFAAGAAVQPIIPRNIEDVHRLARMVVESGLAPRGIDTVPKVMLVIMAGAEVGMPPMQSLQSIALINGRPSLFGDGLLAVVRKRGLLEEIKESIKEYPPGPNAVAGDMVATCVVRRGGKFTRRTFSKQEAQVAGLWNKRNRDGSPTPWQSYPKRMLQMRARAFALRDAFPDVLHGMASAEEQGDIAGNGGAGARVSVAMPPPPPPPPPEPPPLGEVIWDEHEERPATVAD